MISFSSLTSVTGGKLLQLAQDREVTDLVVDSRKALLTPGAVFFAIAGDHHDGHRFIAQLYQMGIRQFVVEKKPELGQFPEGNFVQVLSALTALQHVVIHHRRNFSIPVIGVTGSNAKTIVKEWLYQLLAPDHNIVKNPGSYNSQLGVPLAVWQMQDHHTLGIFEAGMSKPNEMSRLREIIRPTIGLFTNFGSAHDEGFLNSQQKMEEKLNLFTFADAIIYHTGHQAIGDAIRERFPKTAIGWGSDTAAKIKIKNSGQAFFVESEGTPTKRFQIPFSYADSASVENAGHCIALMIHLGYEPESIRKRIAQLKTIPMRLELKQGINHSQLIDDTYNNDLAGLQISIDFLSGLPKKKKTLILSDIAQSGLPGEALVKRIAEMIGQAHLSRFIGIGPQLKANHRIIESHVPAIFFPDTSSFLEKMKEADFQNEAILVKGARSFQFEEIIGRLQKKIHGTVMEVDLGAIVHNLNYIKRMLKPSVKLMVMVKAFAYGSGSEEVASLLQYHKVDYLGVAYPDEGVELRKNHILLPIMVMNATEDGFATLIEYDLEPEIYSPTLLEALLTFLNGRSCSVHLKVDTGMRRLGIEEDQVDQVIAQLKLNPNISVVSIFSHLAGADDPAHDAFTREQAERFMTLVRRFREALSIDPILHILNSPGILRFPDLQHTMVRLGIGLYGIDPTGMDNKELEPAATLKTIISQIKRVKAGESIGYGRSGRANTDILVATIAIGYADGYSRAFSQGIGSVLIKGQKAKVIGNVCMDMTMVDITNIDAKEGDEVIVFGKALPIGEVAAKIKTIPYEILTSTSERVKRVFFAESL